jgi:hypothetical protein
MTVLTTGTAAFLSGEEVSGPSPTRRRQPRQVVRGEGMLVVRESFEFEGEPYQAGRTRVTPDHRAAERFPANFTAAWRQDSSPEVLRFLRGTVEAIDRGQVRCPRPALFGLDEPQNTEPKGHESWRL